MISPLAEAATLWTIRVSMVCYILALGLRFRRTPTTRPAYRWSWTLGCLLFLLHVGCAFHFYHHWSHLDALEETARKTGDTVGVYWGGGLYFNYLFAALWILDTCRLWLAPTWTFRSAWMEYAQQAFFAFMAFNATVVFGHGSIRWFGIATCVGLAVAAYGAWRAGRRKPPGNVEA